MRHVVNLSYGIGSWAAAKLVVQRYGPQDVTLLFCDTKYEDEDTYRWGEAAAKNVGAELVVIADGRDPWEVFRDEKLVGNSRMDPCSKILKRQLSNNWRSVHCDPADTVVYCGIHWSESDRWENFDKKRNKWTGFKHRMAELGWKAEAPLCTYKPLLPYEELHAWAEREGLWKQKLYQEGFPHANCGGRCVKQGQAGWKLLLEKRRESYLEVERQEQEMRAFLGKDVAIMRDRGNGQTRPLTLLEFREKTEAGWSCDLFDFGGCGCFSGVDDDEP